MKHYSILLLALLVFACTTPAKNTGSKDLADQIAKNAYFPLVKARALAIMKSGFNAGDGYREVWIRDYNTFIELASQVFPKEELKENLLVFCRMQGDDWTWFGGRMIQQLIKNGFVQEAYEQVQPW
jgi:hypothetical protein